MKIKKLIKPFIPYGLVMWSREKKRHATFWELYKDFLEKEMHIDLQEESPFKYIVSIQGFGYSGSSAVLDILREYDQTLCLGEIDPYSGAAPDEYAMEVNFLRQTGGMLEIENYLEKHSSSLKDAVLQRFMMLIQSSPYFRYSEEARNVFFEFFNRISYSLNGVLTQSYYNTHLPQADPNHPQIFVLKDMSVSEYRHLCRTCINTLFKPFYDRSHKAILVLDQFFSDGEHDKFDRNYEYCPNLKTINVWRDPRDIFAEAKRLNVEWIPTRTVEEFINWHKMVVGPRVMKDTENYLTVRFEDLLLDYDRTVSRIEKYVGLLPEQHTALHSAFDPNISIRSVRLWKNYPQYTEEFEAIAKAFPDELYKE